MGGQCFSVREWFQGDLLKPHCIIAVSVVTRSDKPKYMKRTKIFEIRVGTVPMPSRSKQLLPEENCECLHHRGPSEWGQVCRAAKNSCVILSLKWILYQIQMDYYHYHN